MALNDRVGKLQQTDNQRRLADFPAEVQLNAIQQILSGQKSFGPEVDNIVKRLAQGGRNPEQIRQAFIEEQRTSRTPLIALGG
ncbi:MAG TPA: hypothetical protein ENI23_06485 [bacterium]|nr:hypothetical protein [bacterium]